MYRADFLLKFLKVNIKWQRLVTDQAKQLFARNIATKLISDKPTKSGQSRFCQEMGLNT